jgi:putative endonuclease
MRGARTFFVYVLASKRNGTLYIGVTNDLLRRVSEHRSGLADGFTKRYGVHRLVWFEASEDVHAAIGLEKRIKHWRRAWKIELIEKANPNWIDLYDTL